MPDGTQREIAGMGRRLWARIIDIFILIGVGLILQILFGLGGTVDEETGMVPPQSLLLAAVVMIVYEATMVAIWGRTVGKMAAQVGVARADNGEVPGWGKSWRRLLILLLPGMLGNYLLNESSILNLLGVVLSIAGLLVVLSPLWNTRRQGWHDRFARTVVFKAG